MPSDLGLDALTDDQILDLLNETLMELSTRSFIVRRLTQDTILTHAERLDIIRTHAQKLFTAEKIRKAADLRADIETRMLPSMSALPITAFLQTEEIHEIEREVTAQCEAMCTVRAEEELRKNCMAAALANPDIPVDARLSAAIGHPYDLDIYDQPTGYKLSDSRTVKTIAVSEIYLSGMAQRRFPGARFGEGIVPESLKIRFVNLTPVAAVGTIRELLLEFIGSKAVKVPAWKLIDIFSGVTDSQRTDLGKLKEISKLLSELNK